MIENYVGQRRSEPLHAPVQQNAAVEETAQNNGLQQVAAASTYVQQRKMPRPEEFTISVEQVREHFRKKGVQKSKDTVQRWCRTGELTCQKRGVLNRYFTTEASLKNLETKILPDMIAETVGEANLGNGPIKEGAAVGADARTGVQQHAAEDELARTGMQVNATTAMPLHAGSSNSRPEPSSDLSRAMAENAGLREQLESKNSEIEFLREEVRAARDQRGAVVQISNRMLETLETIAIGGRLERPQDFGGGDPVRYQSQQHDQSAV